MLSLLIFLLPIAFAKSIGAPYLNFEVPETYNCQTHEAYYQCQDSTGPRMKDSILVVTFKRIGPQDSIEQYLSLLSKPFTRVSPSGPPALSQVISSGRTKIKNWEWATAKHYESDLSNYFTYYWATLRGSVAMMVKYSVLKKNDVNRQKDIQMLAQSLETKNVQFSPPAATTPAAPTGGSAGITSPNAVTQVESQGVVQKMMNLPPAQKYLSLAILLSALLVAAYAIAKR